MHLAVQAHAHACTGALHLHASFSVLRTLHASSSVFSFYFYTN
jgi:hypothetical protein